MEVGAQGKAARCETKRQTSKVQRDCIGHPSGLRKENADLADGLGLAGAITELL